MTEKEEKLMKKATEDYGSIVIKDGKRTAFPVRTKQDMDNIIFRNSRLDRKIRGAIRWELDEVIKKVLKSAWWAQEDPVCGMDPRYYQLRERLLEFGGEVVCFTKSEPDLTILLEYGQLWPGYGAEQSHGNAPEFIAAKKGFRVCTGYALSGDGLWRQHIWCIDRRPRTTKIVETQDPKILYYGVVHDIELRDILAFSPLASVSWTKSDLEECIRLCGGIPDDRAVSGLAKNMHAYVGDHELLHREAEDVEMSPANEPDISLKKMNLTLPACNLCELYINGHCRATHINRYGEEVCYNCEHFRPDWDQAMGCEDFRTSLPKKILRYGGTEYWNDYVNPIISLGGEVFPEAEKVVEALMRSPKTSEDLHDIIFETTGDEEYPGLWSLVDKT